MTQKAPMPEATSPRTDLQPKSAASRARICRRAVTLRRTLAAGLLAATLGACHGESPGAVPGVSPAADPGADVGSSSGAPADAGIPAADVRADFEDLYRTLQGSHFDLFVHTPRAEYDALHASMMADFDGSLSLFEIQTRFQKFMAFGRIGHSRIDFPEAAYTEFRKGGGKTVPFYFRVVDGRVLVTEDYSGTPLSPGDEIVALEGQPMDRWLERLRGHLSAERAYMAHTMLEFHFPRLIWLELGAIDSLDLEIRREDGSEATLEVPTRTREEIQAAILEAPPSLELDWNAREARMLDDRIAYLRPGPSYEPTTEDPYDTRPFRAFIDDAFQSFLEADARALLIDLRDNPGGDNSFSDLMVSWFADRPFRFCSRFHIKVSPQTTASNRKRLEAAAEEDPESISLRFAELYADREAGDVVDFEVPFAQPRQGERFTGEVFVLVNRHSFSNTVMVAALIQDFGFGTILGEETSDLAATYGAMEQFQLPRSGLTVGYPKAYIVRPNGDESVRGVVPDVPIATPVVEGPEDPVLQEALRVVAERPSE
ncbi:MAG: S41 family peptidase [Acidobacteriota bacterium]